VNTVTPLLLITESYFNKQHWFTKFVFHTTYFTVQWNILLWSC